VVEDKSELTPRKITRKQLNVMHIILMYTTHTHSHAHYHNRPGKNTWALARLPEGMVSIRAGMENLWERQRG
jgi:hypothetical protein